MSEKNNWPASAKFNYGDPVEKFTGEARWLGRVVSAYETGKGGLRYVVEVHPQGFQMIAVPAQLRATSELQTSAIEYAELLKKLSVEQADETYFDVADKLQHAAAMLISLATDAGNGS